ncbi:hypothetical protein BBD41_23985 [Paenibacillus ihbetae]|uniref:Polymerase nucleotidyl transferase domain-containing protein n=1 Tax=Paenibacillus ihbetae TaxID=1870820 RepID=A0A1B2E5X6_9BACL|nr:nucleotidyltransferase domain-containing protein [Paenibacillus ihbetae]ANY75388.1 hypothetical protein BBD41_23985 [Paenibacillus ihbetae]
MKMEPIQAAMKVVSEQYPDCLLAVLGGSASRGEHNEHSDLDVIIVEREGEGLRRRTIEAAGWIVELFIVSSSGYREDFDAGIVAANPTLQRIMAEGIVLRSVPEGDNIREEAQADLAYGPLPLTMSDIDAARYMITEYMMDLEQAKGDGEAWFTVQKISTLLCEFVLRVNRQWTGEGKTLFRLVSGFDPRFGEQLVHALEAMYRSRQSEQLMKLCEQVLLPYGGPLLAGYEE